jgi:hypothetical protein
MAGTRRCHVPKMETPPERILRAALEVLFTCACTTRSWTLGEGVSRRQINDLWEAVHEIPSLLMRWRPDAEAELLGYLDEYDSKWPAPQLKVRYLDVRDRVV